MTPRSLDSRVESILAETMGHLCNTLQTQLKDYVSTRDAERMIEELRPDPLDVIDRMLRLSEIGRMRGVLPDTVVAYFASNILTAAQWIADRQGDSELKSREIRFVLEDGFVLNRLTADEQGVYRAPLDDVVLHLKLLMDATATKWPFPEQNGVHSDA